MRNNRNGVELKRSARWSGLVALFSASLDAFAGYALLHLIKDLPYRALRAKRKLHALIPQQHRLDFYGIPDRHGL